MIHVGYLNKLRLDAANVAFAYARQQSDLAAKEVENFKRQIEQAWNSQASAATIAQLEKQLLTARAGQAQAQRGRMRATPR